MISYEPNGSVILVSDADPARRETVPPGTDRAAIAVRILAFFGPPPEPVPAEIARWQCAGQAAAEGRITREEALAWGARGVVPEAIRTKLAEIVPDEGARFEAELRLGGARTYRLDGPLAGQIGALFGLDAAGLRAFWAGAGRIGA